ncbi:MAG: hypothetical protein Q7T73_10260 [Beijerinckiaceae bacterium]|nr:hypothetical protein [Beijerinckiaceae bacterium]
MLQGFRVNGLSRVLVAGASVLLLAGCSGGGGSTIGNLIAFNSPTAPPLLDMKPVDKVECPFIDVPEGTAAVRIMAGGAIRHQYSLGDLSRECVVANGQISIKVGVSGRVLAGPAGGPGSFSVPVRVGIRRESDQKILTSKSYRVAATIPSGAAHASFTLVSDALTVPYTREQANEDYMVVVGFEQGGRR